MRPPLSEFVLYPKREAWQSSAADEQWYELVFTKSGKWPTCTIKMMWDNKSSGPRCYNSKRLRRWPDTKWYENDPFVPNPNYPNSKRVVKPKRSFVFPTDEQIDAAYAIWLTRRMLVEDSGDSRGAADPQRPDDEGRGELADP